MINSHKMFAMKSYMTDLFLGKVARFRKVITLIWVAINEKLICHLGHVASYLLCLQPMQYRFGGLGTSLACLAGKTKSCACFLWISYWWIMNMTLSIISFWRATIYAFPLSLRLDSLILHIPTQDSPPTINNLILLE